MKKIIDAHVHSNHSSDGENSPREMADRAVELGLYALTFTDHIDINEYYSDVYKQHERMPAAASEIPPLAAEYADKLKIGFGAEIAQYMHAPALAETLIKRFKLDFVIGSVHSVRGHEDFYFIDFTRNNPAELMRLYFEEMLEMTRNADIDVIGHLTYTLRYITGKYGITVDMGKYTEIIQKIFKTAAKRGIGLEINTGGLRAKNYGKTDPALEYVKLFKEQGGEIVTIGSDAHRVSDLAAGLREAAGIAEAAGFKRIAYYENRKPSFIDL